ncbi:MAG: Lrp/AsnC family transcriptional regulator, partial [Nonomuraea sp.]|nr:Lrp/AsnC family transcriptional regulator [Nonomuraea sp.]
AIHDDLRCGLGKPVHLRICTEPGAVDLVAESLAARPDVRSVFAITGDTGLWCELIAGGADPLLRLHEILVREFPAMPGMRAAESEVVLRTFATVADWHAPLLPDAAVAELRGCAIQPLAVLPDREELGAAERAVADLLIRDGRMSYTQLAEELGASVPTVRRKVSWLLERRLVRLRAEVEPALLGLQVEVQVGLQVRPAAIDAVGRELAGHPGVRYCAAMAGRHDLLLEVCLPHESDLYDFVGSLHDVSDADMVFVTRAYKRGHLRKDGRMTLSPAPRA